MTGVSTSAVKDDPIGTFASSHRGEAVKALRAQFPARSKSRSWPTTMLSFDQVMGQFEAMNWKSGNSSTRSMRRGGTFSLLQWLESFAGDTWQERWEAGVAQAPGGSWKEAADSWLRVHGERSQQTGMLSTGLLTLTCFDVIRPDLRWLVRTTMSRYGRFMVADHRDPEGFALLRAHCEPALWESRLGTTAQCQIVRLILANGGGVRDITVGDCLELQEIETKIRSQGGGRSLFYAWLHAAGIFPANAPASIKNIDSFTGQLSIEQLVDRYRLTCRPVRDLIVDYLTERQPALDYTSLDDLARNLALLFWKYLEEIHPGIDSLRLPPHVVASWKNRIRSKITLRRLPDGTVTETISRRENAREIMNYIRAFYLDIAQWALEDPARWGAWAAPTPISSADLAQRKPAARRKARMDQRTRERLPVLPILIRAAEQYLHQAQTRLAAIRDTPRGQPFTVLGETFTKARGDRHSAETLTAFDHEGRQRKLGAEERRAFWGWAAIEILRHTGIRIEELLELSHHSITQYRLPDTDELIPLLQIAPSKTDEERLLVAGPELVEVLSRVVCRVRGADGAIPLISSWDSTEKIRNPPLPLLFQWTSGGQLSHVSTTFIRGAINEILRFSGLTDAAGQPLTYSPHDFRRLFTTEAILNGMPPHIAQLLLGHKDINTTMGYKAIYPEEAINGHRAFIARRRALRPSEEYRTPTDEEWDEFLGHFQLRKVALGDCGRAFGTSCQHEHSCVRCPLLRMDPRERRRMEEIRDNLNDRIAEAEHEGWLGEVELLRVTLTAAEGKLAQLDDRQRRATTINLGIPTFNEITARSAALPHSPARNP